MSVGSIFDAGDTMATRFPHLKAGGRAKARPPDVISLVFICFQFTCTGIPVASAMRRPMAWISSRGTFRSVFAGVGLSSE